MIQTTLSIIKPDGTQRNLIGKIVARFEEEGFEIADSSLIFLQNLFPDEIGWPHTNEKKKIRYKITVEVEEV